MNAVEYLFNKLTDNTTGGFVMKRGKRYAESAKNVDRTKLYDADEASS